MCSPRKLWLIAGVLLAAFFVAGIASGLVVSATNRKREEALARRMSAAELPSLAQQAKPTKTELVLAAPRTELPVRLPLAAIAPAPMPREVSDLLADVSPAPRPVELAVAPEPKAVVAAELRPIEALAPVQPVDRCKTFDTKVRFHPTIVEAKDQAKKSKKLVFVLHISGDFDDPGFT